MRYQPSCSARIFTAGCEASRKPISRFVAENLGLTTVSRTCAGATDGLLVDTEVAWERSCSVIARVVAGTESAPDPTDTGPCTVRVPFRSTSSSQYKPPLMGVRSIQP